MATFKQLRLTKRPQPGEHLSLAHYELHHEKLPESLKEGEVLAKVQYLSCDPTLRIWATDLPQYMPPVQLGEVMRALGLAVVEKSNNPGYAVGDRLLGLFGWTEYVVGNPALHKWNKDPSGGRTPVEVLLGPCGATGWTAYFGLLDVGKVRAGDNVLVSGAAGATGSVVVQLAKIAGCRVVAIAGGAEKCKWLKNVAGVDEVIDYKSEDVHKRVSELAGHGYDIYFDNVGGPTLEAALDNLALNARVVLCGAITGYNQAGSKPTGPSNYIQLLMKRATMAGFVVLDFEPRFPECIGKLAAWVQQGKIKFETDVQEGPLEKAPEVLNRLFTGDNRGKQLHKLQH